MSKFFDDLIKRSGLFEEEKPQPTTPAAKPATPAPVSVPGIQLGTPQLGLGASNLGLLSITGQVDENLRKLLLAALTDAKLPSPNYLDFKSSLESTGKILAGLPEDKIFVTVFSTLATAGVTIDKLDQSIKAYLNILETERSEFAHSMDERTAAEVTARESKIAELQEDNETKTKKIQELTESIQQNQSDIINLNAEIVTEKNKIEVASKNFDVTHKNIVDQITSDQSKIDQYLISATS